MDAKAETDGRALQRIAALLFALAGLADRAGGMPFPVRLIVLAILRYAEAVACTFAVETASVSVGRRAKPLSPCVALADAAIAAHDGPADAVRLSLGFRMLATIVSLWASRRLASAALQRAVRLSPFPEHARPSRGWRDAALPPAPDTS